MQERKFGQRLVAILAADGVGYSRLMAQDADSTVAALVAARAAFSEQLEAHGGRLVDTAGDSVLAVFDTASGAVKAALAVQAQLGRLQGDAAEALRFRIGVHLGDVLEKSDGSVYGDGVNVAARLQALAEPGGLAVSQAVLSAVQGRVAANFEDIGEQAVKNIAQPVRAYRVQGGTARAAAVPQRHRATRVQLAGLAVLVGASAIGAGVLWWRGQGAAPSSPGAEAAVGRTTVAVLPFANVGDDKANEFFADGVTEELIDLLSRAQGLRVMPRASSFYFKGKSVPAAEAARQLGASYLVDGSVRRAGERVRITAQLVSAADGSVRWSRTFDRDLKDALSAQAEIALGIAGSLQQPLAIDLTSGGPGTTNVEAWTAFLEAQRLPPGKRLAVYERVLALDPAFARAHVATAVELLALGFGGEIPKATAAERMRQHVEEALKIDPRYEGAYGLLGAAARLANDVGAMRRAAERALAVDPDMAPGLAWMAEVRLLEGDISAALPGFKRSLERLPLVDFAHHQYAECLRLANRPAEALPVIERALALDADDRGAVYQKVRALLLLGREDEALTLSRARGLTSVLIRFGTPQDRATLMQRKDLDPHAAAWQQYWQGRPDAVVEHLEKDHSYDIQQRNRVLFDSEYDPVRQLPPFKDWLARHGLTEAHGRAQAWRAANPVRTSS